MSGLQSFNWLHGNLIKMIGHYGFVTTTCWHVTFREGVSEHLTHPPSKLLRLRLRLLLLLLLRLLLQAQPPLTLQLILKWHLTYSDIGAAKCFSHQAGIVGKHVWAKGELVSQPAWWLKRLGTRRAASLRSPSFWLLLLGGGAEPKQEKVTGCRATPDQHPRRTNQLTSTTHKKTQINIQL